MRAVTLYRVANGLTLGRIAAIPVLVYLVARAADEPRYRLAAVAMVVVLQLSDIADGFFARLARQQSDDRNPLGRLFDPLADKLYIGFTYITLSLTHDFPWWITGVVVARDLLLIGGWILRRMFMSITTVLPNFWGKAADTLQAVLILAFLLALPEPLLGWIRGLMVVMTVVSGAIYVFEGYQVSRSRSRAR